MRKIIPNVIALLRTPKASILYQKKGSNFVASVASTVFIWKAKQALTQTQKKKRGEVQIPPPEHPVYKQMDNLNFKEDFTHQKSKDTITHRLSTNEAIQNKEEQCLEYILKNCPAGNALRAIECIDQFCYKYWMMNLGPEKARIALAALHAAHPKVIVELGGYCGYSALTFAHYTPADTRIYTVEVNPKFADVARKILDHAGVGQKVTIFVGDVEAAKDKLKALGRIDYLFIDHWKDIYLRDFKAIESLGVIQKGSVVVGDNIIYPGSPQYLQYFKDRKDFNSVLYHSYLEYSDTPDAVLMSIKQ